MRVSNVVRCSLRLGLLLVPIWGIGGGTPASALDVTGKWLLGPGIPNPVPADFVQSGSNLSIDAGLLVLSGTIDSAAGTFVVTAGDVSTCEDGLGGLIVGEARLVGTSAVVGAACGFYTLQASGERCECFDGNSASGDGCDARCQIEPCFTCTGDPSVCTPSPDGAACDDRNVCTTGETCTAGACGGGTPVSPCLNLTGQWLEHAASSAFGTIGMDSIVDILQVGTILEFDGSPTAIPRRFGTIDPVTGSLTVAIGVGELFCPFVEITTGTAAADGSSYTLSGDIFEQIPGIGDMCSSTPVTITGARCVGPCVLPTTTTTSTTTTTLPQLLSGRVLLLRDDVDAAQKKLLVKSKDRSFSIGLGNGSSDDPTLAGATVRVRTAAGCGGSPCDAVYVLPAQHWTVVGAPGANKGYKYRDPVLASGPFETATLKPARQLSLEARGAQLVQGLDEDPAPVDVVVMIGAKRSCLTFGGTTSTFKTGTSFKTKDAPAPATCAP